MMKVIFWILLKEYIIYIRKDHHIQNISIPSKEYRVSLSHSPQRVSFKPLIILILDKWKKAIKDLTKESQEDNIKSLFRSILKKDYSMQSLTKRANIHLNPYVRNTILINIINRKIEV